MPVIVERPSPASAQDLIDLAKIYRDAPDWLLPPYADGEALIQANLNSGRLLAGRFNDRLLGAALLERGEDCWRLSHLCVRAITRNRGVARRLLDEASRMAREAGKPLHLAAPEGQLEARALAARRGLPLDSL
ncbi:acetyl-CoA sensor PanZ family protein [Pseudomonas sp. LPB0260]|uniref:acetyl-CoA sensor PanZ family protein n=1 Tax=Pseudomonas sp. LPB0260 TaxID=2614442 RepID=UPI0015C28B4D|nr:acetyl-CoA sensor PanZ family protein [Pseudomonas sp. LPB0260]QLC73421.1 acetyl-CoA sensor PanZ family protein [Pseudomonas sp. LPB0260]QLC76195.1 acetyl-CoA sensor PanZ family protein [Pseudomonas sp. LPB0260]